MERPYGNYHYLGARYLVKKQINATDNSQRRESLAQAINEGGNATLDRRRKETVEAICQKTALLRSSRRYTKAEKRPLHRHQIPDVDGKGTTKKRETTCLRRDVRLSKFPSRRLKRRGPENEGDENSRPAT